jgi:3-oxoacyl-[acyl-carrier protein] reductase
MLSIDLSGHVAVVTGGAGQIGRDIVRVLARAGADVAIAYGRSEEPALRLAEEVRSQGVSTATVSMDVTEADSVARARESIVEAVGDPDILVLNAMSLVEWKPLLEQPPKDYVDQFGTCTLHTVHLTQAFAPAMVQRGWGRIIGINTEAAMQHWRGYSAYGSAKRAMDGLLRVLAAELGPHGITVNQVAPGWTITEDRPSKGDEGEARYIESVPLKRRGTGEETANAVAFLASDLASFVSGVYLPVCGGNVMPGI